MKTIVISSQKGGSAKSTLTAHLAVEAERAGDGPVWLIDTDQQGTLSRWHERRESETPQRMEVPFKALEKGLEKARSQSVAICLIDTAPAISEQSAAIIALADLVVIPVQPSPADLWAVADTIELVKAAGKPFLFVLTKANAQANLTAQSVAALSHHGPVAQAFVANRVSYAAAFASGHTAPELNAKSAAATETTALWQEIKASFNKAAKQQSVKAAKKVQHG